MGFKFVDFVSFILGLSVAGSPTQSDLENRIDRLKRFCGIPTLPTLSDPLCSYAIRLYACIFFVLYKISAVQVVCAYRLVLGLF